MLKRTGMASRNPSRPLTGFQLTARGSSSIRRSRSTKSVAKRKVSAQITVKISDAAGNSRPLTEKIKLKSA